MSTFHPWQFFLITIAGWINRHQQEVIDYLVWQHDVDVCRWGSQAHEISGVVETSIVPTAGRRYVTRRTLAA